MKKLAKILSVVLVIAMVMAYVPAFSSSAAEGDYITMNDYTFQLNTATILANGVLTSDSSKFDDGGRTPEAGDNDTVFWHAGNGDKFTFNMDFGTYNVNEFSYKAVVARGTDTINIYIDGNLVGSGTTDSNGQVSKFALDKSYSGKHSVAIEITSTTTAWPGSDLGFFTFYAPYYFTMNSKSFYISSTDILNYGTVTSDPAKFDDSGRTPEAGDNGTVFWHAGNGDKFTFNVDFGTYNASAMSFYVACSRGTDTINVYIDDDLVGSKAASANGTYVVDFNKAYTGAHKVAVEISSTTVAWPGSDLGSFTFLDNKIVMNASKFTISAKEIMDAAVVTYDETKFERGAWRIAASDDGTVFWHSGNGDTFTFDVDFGDYQVDTFSFNYGGASLTIKVYADGVYMGEVAGADADRNVAAHLAKGKLDKVITGKVSIKLEIVSNATAWPGPDYGYITFYQTGSLYNDGTDSVAGLSASVDEKVGLDFHLDLSGLTGAETVKFMQNGTVVGDAIDVSTAPSETYNVGGNALTLTRFTIKLAAKEMNDTIKIVCYNSGSEAIYTSNSYTVLDYAKMIIAGGADTYGASTVALCKAMLNYGAAAQTYFEYNTENLANADLDAGDKTITASTDFNAFAPSASGTSTNLSFAGARITLLSELSLKVYFKLADKNDTTAYTFEVNDVEVTATKVNASSGTDVYYEVEIPGISVDDYGTDFVITVDGLTVNYSIFGYANEVFAQTGTEWDGVKTLIKAVRAYYDAVEAYIA